MVRTGTPARGKFQRIRQKIDRTEIFVKSFGKSQFPHKAVNLSFIIANLKNILTDLCGNRLFQNNVINTFCEINMDVMKPLHRISGPADRVLFPGPTSGNRCFLPHSLDQPSV